MLNALLSMGAACHHLALEARAGAAPAGARETAQRHARGLQFVRQSSHLQGVLVRISLFFLHSTALIALLPLVARGLPGGGARHLHAAAGLDGRGRHRGRDAAAAAAPHWSRDGLVARGARCSRVAMVAVAFAPDAWVAVPAMFAAGMAWITTANTLSVSAQFGLPDWVRARGMSMYQMAIMGASALGAALWGQVATLASVPLALCVAAATGVISIVLLANRWMPHQAIEEDLTPARYSSRPKPQPPATGHVIV
jgi:hypothetical protein